MRNGEEVLIQDKADQMMEKEETKPDPMAEKGMEKPADEEAADTENVSADKGTADADSEIQ